MTASKKTGASMSRAEHFSFLIITAILILVGVAGLGTPFVTVLFAFLILSLIHYIVKYEWLAVTLFTLLVICVFSIFVFFARQAMTTLPTIFSHTIPVFVDYMKAKGLGFLLPFDDADSLKTLGVESMKEQLGDLANYARIATKEFVVMIISLVISSSLFLNAELDLDKGKHSKKNNLFSAVCAALSKRFLTFYQSFSTVMGAQLLISSINTTATGIFVFVVGLPHALTMVTLTFLCGLLPIVGNLISNTIIFSIALTISINMAVSALLFLVILHKFEYFLNSKIIGHRIRNPMWLTLLGLIVGEKLMGIPGMILAPVILNYIKVETSNIEA